MAKNSAGLRQLCAGIGSPHGDDRIGWLITDEIAQLHLSDATVCQLASAGDLLYCLENVRRLIICDACRGAGPVGSLHRWVWPLGDESEIPRVSSHGMGVCSTLKLAETLGRLPSEVIVWGVEIQSAYPQDSLSPLVERAIPRLVAEIRSELCHA